MQHKKTENNYNFRVVFGLKTIMEERICFILGISC